MELFSKKPNYDFLGKAGYAVILSVILVAASLYIWFERGGQKYGIDFVGGTSVVLHSAAALDTGALEKALIERGLPGAAVQTFEAGSQDYSVRVGLIEGLDAKAIGAKALDAAKSISGGAEAQLLQTDAVGATIGSEMRRQALWAVMLGLVGIVIYIAVRFEMSFAMGALVALFHDVIVGCGVYLFAGHDLNGAALAAALTIVGYSVNDTIVIFDRVREDMRRRKNVSLRQVMNEAMNECLSRTIITSALTLFAVLALFIWGGGAIQDLSLFLLAGMVSGVYSTIYIASPVVLAWEWLSKSRSLKTARA